MAGVEQKFNPELNRKFDQVAAVMADCSVKDGLDITANIASRAIGSMSVTLEQADKIADEWAANVKLLIRHNASIVVDVNHKVNFDQLDLWTIFDRPADHPDGFIARRSSVGPSNIPGVSTAHRETICTDSLDDLRGFMEIMGLTNLGRYDQDDPKIVEVWI